MDEKNKYENQELEEFENEDYGEKRQRNLLVIIIILLILLLLLGLGFFVYEKYHTVEDKTHTEETNNTTNNNDKEKEEDLDLNNNNVISTRLINIMRVLNNSFLETENSKIGYIYKDVKQDKTTFNNNFIIYTAIAYLNDRNELLDYPNGQYNKIVSDELVDKAIQNIFGDISYNKIGYLGNNITCPNGKYDEEQNAYFINTTCQKNNVIIDTHNIKIIEKKNLIEVYQAIAYVKNDKDTKQVYKDANLEQFVLEDKNFKLDVTNYQSYKQYKFIFTKGSDNLYHFDSVEQIS